jgi:hypothetical protein
VFSDEWGFNNSGGCTNFGTFDVNPGYCIRVKQDTQVFFRLMVRAEVASDGQTLITEPDKFKFAVCASMYRIQSSSFPIAGGSLNYSIMRDPVLQTNGGTYSP